MKILHINKFHYLRGGSEMVYFDTVGLLEKHKHSSVFFSMQHPQNLPCQDSKYFISYVDLNSKKNIPTQVGIVGRIFYSFEAKRKIDSLIKKERPDVAHLHNIHHQISPSILHALKKSNVPIVMTLHDFKMGCPAYSMLSNGKVCEACKDGKYYHCFLKGCVKGSRMKSLINTIEMYLHHDVLHIYDLVDVFISPSMFVKNKLLEMGFKGKIVHIPNFVELCDFLPHYEWEENSICYFGRLHPEKGVSTLISAMEGLDVKLKVIGTGEMRESLEAQIKSKNLKNIEFLGYKTGQELKNEIQKSMFMVLPSQCYENNPRSVIEAFALGKPAIGSRIGGIPELIKDDVTGMLFEAGNVDDLKQKIKYLISAPDKIKKMGRNAREVAEKEYNSEVYYTKLLNTYQSILK